MDLAQDRDIGGGEDSCEWCPLFITQHSRYII